MVLSIGERKSTKVSLFNDFFKPLDLFCSYYRVYYILLQELIINLTFEILVSLMLLIIGHQLVYELLHCCHLFWLPF